MKIKCFSTRAFSALELAVIIGVFALLLLFFLPALYPPRRVSNRAQRIQCVNNLKQIGTAYRIFAGDNAEQFPAALARTSTNDGWLDCAKLTNAGALCWSNYTIMQNELAQSPKLLVCPADYRSPSADFVTLRNTNISFFFGPGANEHFPQSILGGDRNLARGLIPRNDFGFSPDDGRGNDVILRTNSPVCWSKNLHSITRPEGAGDILLGDGSVQQCSSKMLGQLEANALDSGNFPSGYDNCKSNSFRLIFP